MKPERWQQVDKLFHAALALDPADRASFLDHACKDDLALRLEVESLIASHDSAGSFISSPAVEAAAPLLADDKPDSVLHRPIGPYRVLSLIGAGGMGEVYLAEDSRLARKVALKLLPAHFTRDEERVRRFKQEAQAASALNHPNIIIIHDIGETDGRHFIATEFVEGETLRQVMAGRRMSLSVVLDVAVQVASALQAAHQAGIIHRDIKPENIMLRPDGIVKVLDFGLAKLTDTVAPQAVDTNAPAMPPAVHTESGVVLGTAQYMSPEQATGKKLDARSDIFSFGAVLYEMVGGHQPFAAESAAATISAILTKEPPPLARYSAEVPAELHWIVTKALRKDREERYQTAKELLTDLRNLKRRLEFEADLERSTPPDLRSRAQEIVETTDALTTQTGDPAAAHATSSAEYLTSEIKKHKRSAVVALAIFIITVAGIAFGLYIWPKQAEPSTPIKTIAVLPFKPLVAESRDESLELGMADTLITRLSNIRQVTVRPTSAVRKYTGLEQDPITAGRELTVESVLDGNIQRVGEQVRVSARLVRVGDGVMLWAGQFDEKFTGIFSVQDSISERVAGALALKLTGEEKELLTKRYTENSEAYQLYLKGRYYQEKRTEEGLKKSVEYFEHAITKDQRYALAYSGLADSFSYLGNHGFLPPNESSPKAKEAAAKALAVDHTLAEAHTSLAYIRMDYDWDWVSAGEDFKRAIELNPSYTKAPSLYACYFTAQRRFDEGLAQIKRALSLDPLSLYDNINLGWHLHMARRHDQAAEQLRTTVDMDPNNTVAHQWFGLVYEQKKMYEEAIAEFQKAISISKDSTSAIAALGHAYAITGKRGEAKRVVSELKELSKQKYVSSYDMAVIFTGLGEKDEAFEWLEKAYKNRDGYLALWVNVDPRFDPLRSDPRFTDLLRRIGFAP